MRAANRRFPVNIFVSGSRTLPSLTSSPLQSSSGVFRLYSTTNAKDSVEDQQQQQQQEAKGAEQQQQEAKGAEQQQQPKPEEQLQARLKDLEEQNKELNSNYLRALADLENMSRISKTNIENAKLYSIKSFAEGMLEIADNLSRAMDAVPPEKRQLSDVKTLLEGVEMTERVLHQVFARYGIKEFNPLNEKFDPSKCMALFEVQDTTKSPGTVAIVQAPGYTLHNRLLRAARVGVVANPPATAPAAEERKEQDQPPPKD